MSIHIKKVLVIDNSVRLTGAFKSIFGVARNLEDVEFTFCIPHRSLIRRDLKRMGVSFFSLPFVELSRSFKVLSYLPMLLLNSILLLRFIKKRNIKVLHVNDLYNMCGVIIKILSPSVKVIYHVRLLPSSYAKKLYPIWMKLVTRHANQILCVSNAVRKYWPDLDNIHVIHDALSETERIPVRVEFSSGTIRFLYLANYIHGKGHLDAMKAFKEVCKQFKNVMLVFAGSDMGLRKNKRYKKMLCEEVKKSGIEPYVVFKDFISDVEAEMKQADIFLNFSESESFSMTCLEALYYGIPCITTDSGGPSEIIVHNESGLIVPVGNIAAMMSAMLILAQQSTLRKEFSSNGRVRARKFFNVSMMAEKIEHIYSN